MLINFRLVFGKVYYCGKSRVFHSSKPLLCFFGKQDIGTALLRNFLFLLDGYKKDKGLTRLGTESAGMFFVFHFFVVNLHSEKNYTQAA